MRQEVFLAVARKIADFQRDRDGDTFRGWLYRITQNKLHDHWRRQRDGLARAGPLPEERLPAPVASDPGSLAEETQLLYRGPWT